jgi:uncharacterized short protein YbdD (DUF466 family)
MAAGRIRRGVRTAGRCLVQGARVLRWYVGELLGDSAYDRYLARCALDGAARAAQPMTAREFWRHRADTQPDSSRCC